MRPRQQKQRQATNRERKESGSLTSTWATRVCASKVEPIRTACELHWKASSDDCAALRYPHLDCRRCDGSSTWFHGIECHRANGSGTESFFGSRLRLSGPARRSDQVAVVGWRWFVFVCEAAGAWTFRLASSPERHGIAHASAVVDVAGRHRLAPTPADPGSGTIRIEKIRTRWTT